MNLFSCQSRVPPRPRLRVGLGVLTEGHTMRVFAFLFLFLAGPAFPQEPWATYRGNSHRTGNIDDHPGTTSPRVVWVYTSKDHFVAAPVLDGERLYVSGLGAFNLPTFSCLSTAAEPKERTLWTKGPPSLKLPTVSSPAVSTGRLIFGD